MIVQGYIEANLRLLDRKYRDAGDSEALQFSKLALLELCGWLEESMDDIILRCAKKGLSEQANLNYVRSEIIKKTSGFSYEYHFRKMLIQLLGIVECEKIERDFDEMVFQVFVSDLTSLKTIRNKHAHTYLKGQTRTVLALNRPEFVGD